MLNGVQRARERLQSLSDTQIFDIVEDIASTITVRTYNEHGSEDISMPSTKNEHDLIRIVAYSAIYTFTHNVKSDVQTILDMAEITLMKMVEELPQFNNYDKKHCNCYCTIYQPLVRLFGIWG